MMKTKYVVGLMIIALQYFVFVSIWADRVYKDQVIAAIEDKGCNTHIDIPANKQRIDNYNLEGFEG